MTLLSYEREADKALERFLAEVRARGLEGEIIPPGEGADIVFSPSPFQQRAKRFVMAAGGSIEDAIDLTGVGQNLRRHIGVFIDGERIERARWPYVRPAPGAAIHIRVELAGGGGEKGKNPLRAILTLALVVVAFAVGGPLTAMFKGLGLSGWGLQAAVLGSQALILTAGQALINAVVPPPKAAANRYAFDQQPGNPYAQITGLRNQAAPYAPIPRVIGKRRLYPMLAARPYTESQGNTQYLRMLLLVGYGPLQITDIRIGNTPISAFAGAEVEIREGWANDTPVTLFTKEIEEEGLSVLLAPSTQNVRTTEPDAREVSIDISFPNGLASYDANGNRQARTVIFAVQYSADGVTWHSAEWIEPNAEYGTATNGFINATASSAQTEIRSGRFALPSAGSYQIRVTRQTNAGTAQDVDTAYWTVLRSIKQDNPVDISGMALIALRLKATAQLNGTPDSINCLAHSYLPVWDAVEEEWNYELSRSPAWGYVDVLRRRGVNILVPDNARFDLAGIKAWADDCAAAAPNADEPYHQVDLVLEGGSAFAAANLIAGHGRAQFALIDGVYTVSRDVAQTVPVQHISPRNASGYRGSKAFVDIPHALRVTFINPNQDDAQDEVIVYRDGYNEDGSGGNTAASKFDTLDLPGCRSATQAWREGRYHFAVLLLRPEVHSVSMDIESLRCTKGDLVRFSYDVVSIGLGEGRIANRILDGGNVTHLALDAPVTMEAGGSYGIRIRQADGTSVVHTIVTEEGVVDTVELTTPVAASATGAAGDLFQFGVAGLETAPMIISRIERGPGFTARVSMVDAQAGIYTADTGTIPPFQSYITAPVPASRRKPANPSFALRSDETAVERFSDGTLIERIAVALAPPRGSDVPLSHWEIEWKASDATDAEWVRIGPLSLSTLTAFLSPIEVGRDYDIRVRTVSATGVESNWVTSSGYEALGIQAIPPDVENFAATAMAEGAELTWDALVSYPDLRFFKIRRGLDWETGEDVADVVGTRVFVALPTFASFTFWIKAFSKTGKESENAASVVATSLLGNLFEPFDATTLAQAITKAWNDQSNLASLVSLQRLALDKLGYVDGIPLGTVIMEEQRQRQEGDLQIAEVISLIGAKTGDNSAFILDMDTAKVGPSESLAERFSLISSTLGDNSASIATLQSVTDGLEALYTIKLDVNGRVTGMYAKATDTTTDFVFIADKFIIIDPSNGLSTPRAPFAVSGGVVKMPNVEVDTFKANSIFAAAINVSSLSAISANLGTVTAGVLQNAGGTTSWNLGTGRMQSTAGSYRLAQGPGIGASSDLVWWFGPTSVAAGSETKTNGVFAFGTDGLVYYGSSALNKGFHARATGIPASASQFGAGTLSTGAVTVTAYNAVGSLEYRWIMLEGSDPGITIDSPTANATTFTATLSGSAGQVISGAAQCIVTDLANGEQAIIGTAVNFLENSTPP